LKKDKSKVLVFSKLTKQIDQICEHTYHSKNKTGNQNIARLNMGEIRVLGVCDALNRGANLIGVDHIIEESYHSSETDFQQRHGRGVRLPINETLHFIILIPWTEVREEETTNGVKRLVWKKKPTQAAKWVENMSQRFDLGEVVTIDMKYDSRTDSYRLP
jgi:superfamily II DNA or RNA helicase